MELPPHSEEDRLGVAALLVPQLLLAALAVMALLRALLTGAAAWADSPLNVSEAIAVRDHALAVRLMEEGQDPNVKRPTDAADGGRSTTPVTALEAAVRRGDVWMVQVVFGHGAVADAAERLRLACIAAPQGSKDIAELLHGSVPMADECQ